jgi:hypothetical protein
MTIYIVVSQAQYDHSYCEHFIHCVTECVEDASRAFYEVDRTGLYKIAVLKSETSGWNTNRRPFEMFGLNESVEHPIGPILEWTREIA